MCLGHRVLGIKPAPQRAHNNAPLARGEEKMLTLIIIAVLVGLSVVVLGIVLLVVNLGEKDVHITELEPLTGKIVKMGKKIVKILFNDDTSYYQKDGTLVTGAKQNLGALFSLTGRIFYGIYPIWKIFRFDVTWGEYIEAEEDGKPPSVVEKTERGCTKFKRFYPHAVMIHGAEMKKEGPVDGKDTSTTRTDAVLLVTIEITNILKAVFKIPPQGIVFEQANAGLQGAYNDYVREKTWATFRAENKLEQNSNFVSHMRDEVNKVLTELDIGMRITIMELKYYDLTKGPGYEKLEESQTLLLVAENEGAANVALAEKDKQAAKLRGEGAADALKAVREVIGEGNIAAYANLQLVQNTELRVYGPTNVVPVIDTGSGGDKKS